MTDSNSDCVMETGHYFNISDWSMLNFTRIRNAINEDYSYNLLNWPIEIVILIDM